MKITRREKTDVKKEE